MSRELEPFRPKWIRRAWLNSGTSNEFGKSWAEFFSKTDPRLFMTARERRTLAALPDEIVVYRGCARGEAENGVSWTLCKRTAREFAKLHDKQFGVVVTRRVRKADVYAYVGRGEEEIIILPKSVA